MTNLLLFAAMTVIWGTTWIAAKAVLIAVPPMFFGAARFTLVAAGLILAGRLVRAAFARRLLPRLLLGGLLANVATYGLLFWGMQFVPSGVAGLTNLSFVAIGLYAFAVLLGQERAGWRHAGALLLGVAGLGILFSRELAAGFSGTGAGFGGTAELLGAAAMVVGTLCYCLGSVLSRPLLEELEPATLTAAHALIGAVAFTALTLAFEPVSADTFRALADPAPLAGLAFMVLFGSFVAYTVYMRLVRDWGAPRAGLYAFTSPVIALVLGALVYGEPLGLREAGGAVLMLGAAAFAVRLPRPAAVSAPAQRLRPESG